MNTLGRRSSAGSLSALGAAVALALVLVAGPVPASEPDAGDDLIGRAGELNDRGQYHEAMELARRALSISQQTRDRHLEARALDQIGNAYWGTGHTEAALEHFLASLEAMREVGDRPGEAAALKDAGIALRYLGRHDEALEYLHRSLEIFEQVGDAPGVMSATENIGSGYVAVGAFNRALAMFERVLESAEAAGDRQVIFSVRTRLGFLLLALGHPERALEHFEKAEAIVPTLDLPPTTQAWPLMGTSDALAALGRTEEAVAVRLRSLDITSRSPDEINITSDLVGLGVLNLESDPAAAVRYLRRALEISERYGVRQLWPTYTWLASAYRRLGQLDRAVEYYEVAVDNLEAVRGQLTSDQNKATFHEQARRVYEQMVETLMERHALHPDGGDDVRAFALCERAKARAMLDALAAARVDAGGAVTPDLRTRLEEADARLLGLQRRLLAPGLGADARRRLLDELSAGEADADRLVAEVRRQDPRYAALRYPSTLSLDGARALLDGRTALVSYLVGRDRIFAFVVTETTFRAVPLDPRPGELAARVGVYVDVIARGDGRWQAISRRLHRDLAAPVLDGLPPQIDRLVIVPDGALHYLPFETLTSGDGEPGAVTAGLLLERFSISYAPSATVLAELDEPREGSSNRAGILLFANPALGAAQAEASSVPRLAYALYEDENLSVPLIPSSGLEAEAVGRYRGPQGHVYTGRDASESRVKGESLARYRVLHFAAHGLLSERASERSALVLAEGVGDPEDGFLQAREIFRLELDADLVVLSACRSARGPVLEGEGAEGLARAFLYAGARSVVASLWDVDDARTAAFMERFYGHLAEGRPKAEALRAAKLDLLREDAGLAPRSWAPFILIGEARRPVPLDAPDARGVAPVAWAALAIVALSLAAAAAARRARVSLHGLPRG